MSFAAFCKLRLKIKKKAAISTDGPGYRRILPQCLGRGRPYFTRRTNRLGVFKPEDCSGLAKQITEETLPAFWGDIAANSGRYQYLAACLEQTLAAVLWAMARQFQKGEFRPVAWEISFGPHEVLPALHVDLPDGGSLELRGRIDRVDMAQGEAGLWLRVVDYKSSKQTMTLNDVFYGLKMQLLAYLQVVMGNAVLLALRNRPKPQACIILPSKTRWWKLPRIAAKRRSPPVG